MKLLKSVNRENYNSSYAIAHELRNPLTNVMLSCEHVKGELCKEGVDKESLLNCIAIIERSCGRMNQLIGDFVQNDKVAEIGNKSLNDIIEESLSLAGDRINLKKVTIEKCYQLNKSFLFPELEKLRVAFLNIIINAIESMEFGKGILQITSSEDASSFFVKFSDNGSGMCNCEMNKLFQPYFTKKSDGLGIGLFLTKNILEEINATISVESILGKGTSFTIKFNNEIS
ncbi:MAG: HAMP domain-containing histidine kinase [Bacteroidota bacterium]|nr:HAMP domain-containing histidine kinase [Bacteroidota bacterium]